ncbi:MAG: uracil-DNA glycosylase family protein [Pseudomonadota bacterium]
MAASVRNTGVGSPKGARALAAYVKRIRACRVCIEQPVRAPLPHKPRPILRVTQSARLGLFSQAPGIRAHEADLPFKDPSGVRLRAWLGLDEDTFYDADFLAIAPMGFCFPGYDAKGGDLPPRRECAPTWRADLLPQLAGLELALLVGSYAQRWHLGSLAGKTLTDTVKNWETILDSSAAFGPAYLPLPHPSWRNNGWLKTNPWFEAELVPELQRRVQALLAAHQESLTQLL